MKEFPIFLTGPEVRDVLDGRKTQTRSIVRPQPVWVYAELIPVKTHDADPNKGAIACPWQPGDRLWVREPARLLYTDDGSPFVSAREGARVRIEYLADNVRAWVPYPPRLASLSVGSLLPMGTYREASRISLEITKVRAQRVQDISYEDALAEGVYPTATCLYPGSPRRAFLKLWEARHGSGSNPVVWVREFKLAQDLAK